MRINRSGQRPADPARRDSVLRMLIVLLAERGRVGA